MGLTEQFLEVGQRIGNTPTVQLMHEKLELYAKLEFHNPTGSLKDRPAFRVLKAAIEEGKLRADSTIIESSSGNMALALASFCQTLNLQFIPVIDRNISPRSEALLRQMCARVEKLETVANKGSFLIARLERVQSLLKSVPNSYWTDQYSNLNCVTAHYETTGREIVSSFPHLDYAFIGVGSMGTICGLSARLKETYPNIKIIAVDAVGSVIYGAPAGPRFIPGIGAGIVPPMRDRAQINGVIHISEIETVEGCHELQTRHGVFAGGSSGTCYAAINKYFASQKITTNPKVIFLCADSGTTYQQTIYSPEWVKWLRTQY